MPLNFPSNPTVGQQSTQNGRTYQWSGKSWRFVSSGGGGGGSEYTLPTATASILGGVKVGSGLSISNGVLSTTADSRWDFFLPGAPTNLAAAAGNAQASLTWTAPSVISQIPITDYVVQFKTTAASTWDTFSDGNGTTTSATVTGLTNGQEYQFRVAGVNGVGQGPWSSTATTTPVAGDPHFANVSLLLHMNGSNGSTSFVDSGPLQKTVTAHGGAQVSTSQSKFGGGSLSLILVILLIFLLLR